MQEAARRREHRREDARAPGGDHRLDDAQGARTPDLLNASRKRRIAAGSGTSVQEVNKLLKQHRQMQDMMKKMARGKGLGGAMAGMMGGRVAPGMGGMGDIDPVQLERMAREMGMDPAALQQAGGGTAQSAKPQNALPTDVKELLKSSGTGLPGLGGAPRFPGLPGLGGKGGKEVIPRLRTGRLLMRGWRNEDFDAFAPLWMEPGTAAYIGGAVATRGEAWRKMATMAGHWNLRGFGFWVMQKHDDPTPIGFSGLWYPIDWPEPEVGWSVLKQHQRQGYASEAAQAAMRYAAGARLEDADQRHSQGQCGFQGRR